MIKIQTHGISFTFLSYYNDTRIYFQIHTKQVQLINSNNSFNKLDL